MNKCICFALIFKIAQTYIYSPRKKTISKPFGVQDYEVTLPTQAAGSVWGTVFLCACVLSHFQSCSTLCDPMDWSLLVSSIHRIFQARILECVAMPSSRDLPNPGIKPTSLNVTWIGRQVLYCECHLGSPFFLHSYAKMYLIALTHHLGIIQNSK